jgi:hypothetical protein
MADYQKFNDARPKSTAASSGATSTAGGGRSTTKTDYQNMTTYDGVYKQRQQQQHQQQQQPKQGLGSALHLGRKGGVPKRTFKTIYDDDVDDDSDGDYFHMPHPRPEYYMTDSMIDKIQNDSSLTEYDIMVIQRLACRKFHIPGNSFIEDYLFWFRNNHIMFSFCYADPRHPFGKRERVLNLISSLAFGLAATCCVVLWFHYHQEPNSFNHVRLALFDTVSITNGMIVLFVFR